MVKHRVTRTLMLCLGVTLLLTPACKDDEVVAEYTCNNSVCEPDEDFENCPQDCAGPQFPGPCFGESTAVASAHPNPDYLMDYELVDGRLRVSKIYDYSRVGGDNFGVHYTFDSDGKMIVIETDSDDDGVVDSLELNFYDEQGRLTHGESRSGDGAELLAETTYVRDATGYLVRKYTESIDAAGEPDGLLSEITYEWNGDYSVCMERNDLDGDGSLEFFTEVTYDADGLVFSRGMAGGLCEYTYDRANLRSIAPGALVQLPFGDIKQPVRLLSYYCTDYNSSSHNGESYIYDEHGNLLRLEFSWDDQPVNPTHTTTFTYDCWQ